MKAYTYLGQGKAALLDKPEPQLQGPRDALVRVTLGSICTSDLHILHGSVPRAVPGITLGHEMVGVWRPSALPWALSGRATGWRSMWRRSAARASSAVTAM